MKCIIPGSNVKIFARAIHSLSRVGDELYIQPHSEGVSFRAVNSSRSAFAFFDFKSQFFSYFDSSCGLESSSESVKFKVAMRACINVFKSLPNVEKSVEKCKLVANPDEDKLVVNLICKHGINKTYNLSFIECETLDVIFERESCLYNLESQARVLSDSFSNFHSNQEEVTLSVTPQKAIIRSYVDDEPDPSTAMHTELTLERDEFDTYNIKDNCEVTFCLREVRALLSFSESMSLPVSFAFSKPGSPLIFTIENIPWFEGNFVLATLASQIPTQMSSLASTNHIEQKSLYRTSSKSFKRPIENGKKRLSEANASDTIAVDVSKIYCSEANNSHNRSNNATAIPINIPINEEEAMDVDNNAIIPGTPPAKRKKYFFQRCFEATFSSDKIPGHNRILAEDSDPEDN